VPALLVVLVVVAVGLLVRRGVDRFRRPPEPTPADELPIPPPATATVPARATIWLPQLTPSALALTPDGKRLVIAGTTQDRVGRNVPTVQVWDLEAGREAALLRDDRGFGRFTAVALSPDGSAVAAGGTLVLDGGVGGGLAVWDLSTGNRRWAERPRAQVNCLAWSPDGGRLACGDFAGQIRIVAADTGSAVAAWPAVKPDTGGVAVLAWSSDGARLASAGNEPLARVWDVAGRREVLTLSADQAPFADLAFAPDGQTIWGAGGVMGDLRRWDAASGRDLGFGLGTGPTAVSWFRLNPDGRTVVVATEDGRVPPHFAYTLRRWEIARSLEPWRTVVESDTPSDRRLFAATPNGRLMAVAVVEQREDGKSWRVLLYDVPVP